MKTRSPRSGFGAGVNTRDAILADAISCCSGASATTFFGFRCSDVLGWRRAAECLGHTSQGEPQQPSHSPVYSRCV